MSFLLDTILEMPVSEKPLCVTAYQLQNFHRAAVFMTMSELVSLVSQHCAQLMFCFIGKSALCSNNVTLVRQLYAPIRYRLICKSELRGMDIGILCGTQRTCEIKEEIESKL